MIDPTQAKRLSADVNGCIAALNKAVMDAHQLGLTVDLEVDAGPGTLGHQKTRPLVSGSITVDPLHLGDAT